jgi:hypothetical protein
MIIADSEKILINTDTSSRFRFRDIHLSDEPCPERTVYRLPSNDPACAPETNTVEKADSKDALVNEDTSVGVTDSASESRAKHGQEFDIEPTRNAGSVVV